MGEEFTEVAGLHQKFRIGLIPCPDGQRKINQERHGSDQKKHQPDCAIASYRQATVQEQLLVVFPTANIHNRINIQKIIIAEMRAGRSDPANSSLDSGYAQLAALSYKSDMIYGLAAHGSRETTV